jgi:hypothetical protein
MPRVACELTVSFGILGKQLRIGAPFAEHKSHYWRILSIFQITNRSPTTVRDDVSRVWLRSLSKQQRIMSTPGGIDLEAVNGYVSIEQMVTVDSPNETP